MLVVRTDTSAWVSVTLRDGMVELRTHISLLRLLLALIHAVDVNHSGVVAIQVWDVSLALHIYANPILFGRTLQPVQVYCTDLARRWRVA